MDNRQMTAVLRPEDVLTDSELEILRQAGEQELPCPRCGLPLLGEFIYLALEDDDQYAGVRLSCSCGYVEY